MFGVNLLKMGKKSKIKSRRKFKKHPVEVFFEFFLLIFLIPVFLSLSYLVAIGYLFAFFGSLWRGTFFRKKNVARLIIFGSVLTYIAGMALKYGLNEEHGIVAFVLIMLIAFYAWYGFGTCVLMVAGAKLLGVLLKRPDSYYE